MCLDQRLRESHRQEASQLDGVTGLTERSFHCRECPHLRPISVCCCCKVEQGSGGEIHRIDWSLSVLGLCPMCRVDRNRMPLASRNYRVLPQNFARMSLPPALLLPNGWRSGWYPRLVMAAEERARTAPQWAIQAVHDRSEESWDVARAQACGQLTLRPSTFQFPGPSTGIKRQPELLLAPITYLFSNRLLRAGKIFRG